MGAPNGLFEWAEERYRLASIELAAARTEVDAIEQATAWRRRD
jgi:hypothetical protein